MAEVPVYADIYNPYNVQSWAANKLQTDYGLSLSDAQSLVNTPYDASPSTPDYRDWNAIFAADDPLAAINAANNAYTTNSDIYNATGTQREAFKMRDQQMQSDYPDIYGDGGIQQGLLYQNQYPELYGGSRFGEYSAEDIRNTIIANYDNPAALADAAKSHNLSYEDIAAATGLSPSSAEAYLTAGQSFDPNSPEMRSILEKMKTFQTVDGNKYLLNGSQISALEQIEAESRRANSDGDYNMTTSQQSGYAPAQFLARQYSRPQIDRLSDADYDKLQNDLVTGYTAPLQRYEELAKQAADEDLAKRGIWSSGIATRAQGDIAERMAPQYAQLGATATDKRYALEQNDINAYNQLNQGYYNTDVQNATANRQIDTSYDLGLRNNALGYYTADQNYDLGQKSAATNQYQAETGRQQTANNYALGQGQLDLGYLTQNDNYALQQAQLANTAAAQQAQAAWQAQWDPATYLAGLWNGTGGVISSGTGSNFSI